MTGRWITVSLVALALAGCNKKEAAKPPEAKTETAAPTPAPTTPAPAATPATSEPTSEPAAEETGYKPTPPAPGVTPVTTPDAPPTFLPAKPLRPMVMRPPVKVVAVKTPVKVVKSKAQLKAERDVLGLWIEQKRRKPVLNFTSDGKVALRDTITSPPLWKGEWKADRDGAVQFTLSLNNPDNPLRLTAYPTPATIMAVAPHWTKEWGGSGQYAYERMK